MKLVALWHPKAKLWVNGRKHLLQEIAAKLNGNEETVWFHFASLGEFEQGRPVMEALKKAEPKTKLIVTFFSPSGYEIRKNYALAEAVYYLPLDTQRNAAEFIRLINPKLAVFTKYEYWFFFFRELSRKQIPLYIISGIFRKNQVFFKWYGGLHRQMLRFVTHFFVQNAESENLLDELNIRHVSLSSDTRFDRVAELAQNSKELPEVKTFCQGNKIFIAGSTWPQDEALLPGLMQQYPDWKFIIAPHEVGSTRIQSLCDSLKAGSWIKYSELINPQSIVHSPESTRDSKLITEGYQVLIVDNIGLLSSLYAYADIAYIGGGFGAGIHNTLEAAAYGLPVIFGPKYQKFQEAKDLIAASAGFSIQNSEELLSRMALLQDETVRKKAGEASALYVQKNTGATAQILQAILPKI